MKVKSAQKHCLLKEFLKDVVGDESCSFGENEEFEELVCFETWLKERETATPPHPLPVASPAPEAKAPPVVAAPAAKATGGPPRDTRSTGSATLDIRVQGNALGTTLGLCIHASTNEN